MNTILNNIYPDQYRKSRNDSPSNDLNVIVNWKRTSKYVRDFDFVTKTLYTYNWNAEELSSNHHITLNFIEYAAKNEFYLNYGQYGLSANPAAFPLISSFPDAKEWYWGDCGVSLNPALTKEFLESYKDRFLYGVSGLSSNRAVPIEFVYDNKDRDWDWTNYGVSRVLLITKDDVKKYDLPWNKEGLELNQFYLCS